MRIKENPILTSWSDMTKIWEKATAQVCLISVKRRGLQFPMLLLFIHLAACLCATLPCPVAHLVMRWRVAEHPIEYLGASTIWPFQQVGFKQNQFFAFNYIKGRPQLKKKRFLSNYLNPPPWPQFGQLGPLFSEVEIQDLKVSLELKILYILYNILYICNLKNS